MAEGFIEPHLFAGFSGGRKSILPGIAGKKTIIYNHSAEMLDHSCTRAGQLKNNIVHEDMKAAAQEVGLSFILNVALDDEKNIIGAFAGNEEKAFLQGAAFVEKLTGFSCHKAEIVVTGNGGYPLDQNLYQAVKSICTAEYAVKENGVIIVAASCLDGIGGDNFYNILAQNMSPAESLAQIRSLPPTDTSLDQWQAHILLRALTKCKIIIVTEGIDGEILDSMGLKKATTLEAALEMAYKELGEAVQVLVISNGAGVCGST